MSEEESIWEFISINDYIKPNYIFEQSFKTRLSRFTKKFSRSKSEDVYLTDLDKLKEFPQGMLNRIFSAPDFTEPINKLNETLSEWLKGDPSTNDIVFILNPPYSNTSEIVSKWASKNKISTLVNPTYDQILDQSFDIKEQFKKNSNNVYVIPNLEKFYLRHYNGLHVIRNLFLYLWNTESKIIICVNSWSWVYLQKALKIDSFGVMKLVLGPFDYKKFDFWFKSLKKDLRSRKIVFRKADDGNYVINPDFSNENDKKRVKVDYNFLKNLTAYSEGIPNIGWIIWRYSLMIEPDVEFYEKNDEVEDKKVSETILTTWIIPWQRLKLPGNIADVKLSELLILQSVLLHDGLDEIYLGKVLPLTQTEVMVSLNVLKASNLIKKEEDEWKVTPVSYPYVKKILVNNGFFSDKF